jgi:hypothetical protein
MLLLNLIPLIDVTFSTPTPHFTHRLGILSVMMVSTVDQFATTIFAMRIGTVFVVLAITSVAGSAVAQEGNCTHDSSRPDCPGAIAFFHRFQSALQSKDRRTIAAMVTYPVLTSINHKRVRIRTQQQLLAHFDDIFDAGLRCSILNATEKDVWGNWQGFTVGEGAVWFDRIIIPQGERLDTKAPDYWTKHPFKIKTINNDAEYPCSHT